jgi:predicted cupin superfamily sugar epimerase
MHTAEFWIEHLQLSQHPEGGFFRETWRSTGSYHFSGHRVFSGDRPFATSIYYLLQASECSRLHMIKSDELWFFHEGSPLTVHLFHPEGISSSFLLGNNSSGEVLQGAVRAGTWFGALHEHQTPDAYSLVSCVVAPGFDFKDFSFADRDDLIRQFPLQKELIERLT